MSSYIAPSRYANKSHFNSTEFKSSLTIDDLDTKIDSIASNTSQRITSGIWTNTSGVSSDTVSFGVTYATAPTVVCTSFDTNSSDLINVQLKEVTTTGFTFKLWRYMGDLVQDTSSDAHWIAIGSV